MKHIKSTCLTALSCLILSACATTPDPAKICTADWIGARSDKAISRIETRSKSSLKALSKAGKTWAQGKQPGVFQLLALSNAMGNLKKELTSGQGVTDLRTLASTCNDPEIISTAMKNLLDRQDFSDSFKNMIEQNPLFERVIEEMSAGIGTKT